MPHHFTEPEFREAITKADALLMVARAALESVRDLARDYGDQTGYTLFGGNQAKIGRAIYTIAKLHTFTQVLVEEGFDPNTTIFEAVLHGPRYEDYALQDDPMVALAANLLGLDYNDAVDKLS